MVQQQHHQHPPPGQQQQPAATMAESLSQPPVVATAPSPATAMAAAATAATNRHCPPDQPHQPKCVARRVIRMNDELTAWQRMVSASFGAFATSFFVTPFDVVRIRLQGQFRQPTPANPAFEPPASSGASSSAASTSTASSSAAAATTATKCTCPPPKAATTATATTAAAARPAPSQPLPTPVKVFRSSSPHETSNYIRMHAGAADVWCSRCRFFPDLSALRSSAAAAGSASSTLTASASSTLTASAAGAAAGAAAPVHFTGNWDAALKLVRHEGPSSLWRGLSPALLMSVPNTAVYFTVYDWLKPQFQDRLGVNPGLAPLYAGVLARSLTSSLVSPLELIRTKAQHLRTRASSLQLVRDELAGPLGVRGLFRGLGPTLWRDVPFSAIYWVLLERLRLSFLEIGARRSQAAAAAADDAAGAGSMGSWSPPTSANSSVAPGPAATTSPPPPIPLARAGSSLGSQHHHRHPDHRRRDMVLSSFFSGAIAGAVAAVATHPFDLIKTRRQIALYELADELPASCVSSQAKPVSTAEVWRTIVRQEGWRGLYTGLGARIAKITPSCAVMISTYELAKSYISRRRQRRRERQQLLQAAGGSASGLHYSGGGDDGEEQAWYDLLIGTDDLLDDLDEEDVLE